MNIKTIAIALTVLVVAVLATVLMQKGNYVSQATEHYEKTTTNTFKGSSKIIEYVSNSIDQNKLVWALACDAVQSVKTSQDMAKLEAKYFPTTKGSNSLSKKTRRFEATSAYFIVSSFDKVDEDKKTQLKTLSGLNSIDVSALLGQVAAAAPAEEVEGEGEEYVEE
ncbi:MAG: hypothetical protein MJY82_10595 [Fibrobacter sp.]|nr:hypothetical protein [Fibrobacter sp.]